MRIELLTLDEFKAIRKKFKLSQRKFARFLGWNQNYVSQLEGEYQAFSLSAQLTVYEIALKHGKIKERVPKIKAK